MINDYVISAKGFVRNDLREVKAQFANLEVQNFSITAMLEKEKAIGDYTSDPFSKLKIKN